MSLTRALVLDPGVGLALERRDPRAVAQAELDQALLGDPVDPGEAAAGDDLVADLDDGGDLAVEHVRRPVRRVARHHRGLRHVDRGAGLRHQADQDRGRQERQQDTTTHE
jgi:hypothetical protein